MTIICTCLYRKQSNIREKQLQKNWMIIISAICSKSWFVFFFIFKYCINTPPWTWYRSIIPGVFDTVTSPLYIFIYLHVVGWLYKYLQSNVKIEIGKKFTFFLTFCLCSSSVCVSFFYHHHHHHHHHLTLHRIEDRVVNTLSLEQ